MQQNPSISIVYVADVSSTKDSPALRMVQTSVAAVNESTTSAIEVSSLPFEDLDRWLFTQTYSAGTIFLVNLTEPLCSRDEANRVTRGEAYSAVARLIDRVHKSHVFLILPPDVAISGIDLVACLSAGVAGVIEERSLILAEVVHKMTEFDTRLHGSRRALLIGSPKDKIEQAHTTVLEWNEDLESNDRLDLWTWRTAVALAQLEKLEPIIGFGQLNSYKTLAAALNLAGKITSFGLNVDELQRVLSNLSRRWLGEDHESRDRFRLPELARRHGFPRLPVHATCRNKGDIDKRIYETLQEMTIQCAEDLAGMQCCEVEI